LQDLIDRGILINNTMEYRRVTNYSEIKKLWRLRYRFYAILVLILSVFVFSSDTATAVKVVVPEDSLNYRITNQTLFTSEIEYRRTQDNFEQVDSIVYQGDQRYVVKKDTKLVSDPVTLRKVDKLGYIYSRPKVDFNPGTVQPEDIKAITLNDLVPAPSESTVERRGFLEYPKFSIKTPVLSTTSTDLYNTKDGVADFTNPIIEDPAAYAGGNYESTPVLRKLLDGVVLLNGVPFLPEPGEFGNSYIVGHGRNYANAGSPYSQIFEPLVNRSEEGDLIYVWDQDGRKLTFKVFRNDLIDFTDVESAYGWTSGEWKNRRIITLQTCKLEWTPSQGWYPTKRWLVRAELQL
jgi:sortase (surface protein transpeptidase)